MWQPRAPPPTANIHTHAKLERECQRSRSEADLALATLSVAGSQSSGICTLCIRGCRIAVVDMLMQNASNSDARYKKGKGSIPSQVCCPYCFSSTEEERLVL